jgi:hypothetical protein
MVRQNLAVPVYYGLPPRPYTVHLANDSASTERATFQNSAPPENSFKVFSHAYKSAKIAMRLEIAPPSILARIRHAIQGP